MISPVDAFSLLAPNERVVPTIRNTKINQGFLIRFLLQDWVLSGENRTTLVARAGLRI
jgi:hypothetical protein